MLFEIQSIKGVVELPKDCHAKVGERVELVIRADFIITNRSYMSRVAEVSSSGWFSVENGDQKTRLESCQMTEQELRNVNRSIEAMR